ncbi:MAG: DUF2191 domain-containing protein [Verrucomicrobiota bacterium]
MTSSLKSSTFFTMRTTLTLDDDLAGLLKERAEREGKAFRTIVNQVIRAGLSIETGPMVEDPPKVIPHAFGLLPGIDPDKMNHLADDLEVEAYGQSLKKSEAEQR